MNDGPSSTGTLQHRAPSTRLWDLAYAAQAFTLSNIRQPPKDSARNLAAFVNGYGADPGLRADIPAAMHSRAAAMYDLLRNSHEAGQEPWGTMYANGHGDHWLAATQYAGQHQSIWAEVLLPPAR